MIRIIAGIGMLMAMAESTHAAPPPFACTVEGAGAIAGQSEASVCAVIRRAVDRARAADAAIAIAVRIDKRSLVATVVERRGAAVHSHPESIAVDVMDRATQPEDVERLAAAIAQAVAWR